MFTDPGVTAFSWRIECASTKRLGTRQATQLAAARYRAAAIDFRGCGKSLSGPKSQSPSDELYLDLRAAVDYLRFHVAKSVAVIGASLGGRASANTFGQKPARTIDRLVLLAPVSSATREENHWTGRLHHAESVGAVRKRPGAEADLDPRWIGACPIPHRDRPE